MKPLTLLILAVVAAIGSAPAQAGPRTEKVYGPNGRRVAVIRDSNFGRRIYGQDGRRVATIKAH